MLFLFFLILKIRYGMKNSDDTLWRKVMKVTAWSLFDAILITVLLGAIVYAASQEEWLGVFIGIVAWVVILMRTMRVKRLIKSYELDLSIRRSSIMHG